ncbi:MAG: flippase-like domain-containing protein [Deltaproteobacteria bacterium]|nr:flippase-like domain-containing protein [Deltaproteobacteria bacterium]
MKKLLTRLLLSLVIGGGLLYLAIRSIEFEGTVAALKQASWWVLGPYYLLMTAQHLLRSWRWSHLLAPIAGPVPFSRILPISTVGFFAILALPLRMGEFVRPYLIADPPRLRMSQALGTLAVERVFDGLILALTAFVSIELARRRGIAPTWLLGTGYVALALFLIALIVLVMALWQRDRAVTLCRKLVGLFSKRLADRAASIAAGVVDGFRVLPNVGRLAMFVLTTCGYWALNAAAFWALSWGFGMGLTFGGSMAFTSLIGIGIMVPAGPGFIGNFELFADGALGMYADPSANKHRGAAFILASHAANAAWYIIAGAIAMFSAHVTFRKVWTISTSSSTDENQSAPANATGDRSPVVPQEGDVR